MNDHQTEHEGGVPPSPPLPETLHDRCERIDRLAKDGRLQVIDDGERRPFRTSEDQPVGAAWDRVCHKDGRVWVEAWADGYLKDKDATPRYLDFAETY